MTRLLRWLRTGQWTSPTHEPVELNGRKWCVHDGGAVPWPCGETKVWELDVSDDVRKWAEHE